MLGVAQVVAFEKVLAMGHEAAVEHAALRAGTEAEGPGCGPAEAVAAVSRVEAAAERHGRERTAHLVEHADLPLDAAHELHPLEEVQIARPLVAAHEDFHWHEGPELRLEPAVVFTDAGLRREEPHQLHAAFDLRHTVADGHHHEQACRCHQAIVPCDPFADPPPAAVLDRLPVGLPFAAEPAELELGWKELECRRHERHENQEADHHADRREDAEHPDRHEVADGEGGQADGRGAGGERERQECVAHRMARCAFLDAGLGELIAVVVGEVDRTARRCHVDERGHGEQDRVDGIARIPDDREAREHAVDARGDHHAHEGLALEAPPAHKKSDDER